MKIALHLDQIIHLFTEHTEEMLIIASRWPFDAEGNPLVFKASEMPPEIIHLFTEVVMGDFKETHTHDHPYEGQTIVSKRPTYLPADAPDPEADLRIPPMAYFRRDDEIHEYYEELPPLDIPGESGDTEKHQAVLGVFEPPTNRGSYLLNLNRTYSDFEKKLDESEKKRQARKSKGKFIKK